MNEILVDANAVLRFILNDNQEQADQVQTLLEDARDGRVKLVMHSLTIAEIVFVLSGRHYQVSRHDIRQRLEAVCQTPGLEVEEKSLILSALKDYEEKNVDYIDAYSVAWMKARGINNIASFDKHFKRYPELQQHLG